MRKGWLIGACLVAALALGAVGATFWTKGRATAEVERTFVSLRASGATATYGAVNFDLWSRALRVADISVTTPGDRPSTWKAASVVAEGVSPWSSDISASRLEFTGIESTLAFGSLVTMAQTAPSAVLQDFRMARAMPVMPPATDAVVRQAAWFATMQASTISIPTVTVAATLPATAPLVQPRGRPAAPASYPITYTYSNVKIDGLADGRMAQFNVGSVAIAGGPGAPMGRGTMLDLKVADIDMLPYFGLGLDRRKAVDGYYPVQGKFSAGTYSLAMPDGGTFECASISGDSIGIDPSKISHAKLADIFAAIGNMAPTAPPPQIAAAATTLANVYEGMSMSGFEMRGLRIKNQAIPQAFDIGIGAISMAQLKHGKLGEMRVDKIDTIGAGAGAGNAQPPFKLNAFALQGLDLAGIMRTTGRMLSPPPGQSPMPDAMLWLPMLAGFELNGLSMQDPQTRQPLDIEIFKASWGQFINGIPTSVRLLSKSKTPVSPTDPNMAILRDSGLRILDAQSDIGTAFDAAKTMFRVSPIEISVVGLGTVSGELTLGKVAPSAFSTAPGQFAAAAQNFQLDGLDLTIKDGGVLAFAQRGAGLAGPPDVAAQQAIGFLRQMLDDPAKPGVHEPLLQGLSRFLAKPGQTLALKARPKTPLSVAQLTLLLAQPVGGAGLLLEQLNIEAQVRP
ncbi:MAG: hypothetical protein ACKVP7_15185 [Hyphomicrobiaceae bacterium]